MGLVQKINSRILYAGYSGKHVVYIGPVHISMLNCGVTILLIYGVNIKFPLLIRFLTNAEVNLGMSHVVTSRLIKVLDMRGE